MSANEIQIHIVPGQIAPQYDTGDELDVESVTITEEGTAQRLPLVDIRLRGPNDEKYLAVLTGRVVIAIAAAIKGINKRVHGREEP